MVHAGSTQHLRLRQNCCEFKASLCYLESSRKSVRTTNKALSQSNNKQKLRSRGSKLPAADGAVDCCLPYCTTSS